MNKDNLNHFFKSIVDNDKAPIVICNLQHIIIYMNPSAISNYSKRGGEKLIGCNLLDCHNQNSIMLINKVVDWFKNDYNNNIMYTYYDKKNNKDVYMIALRDQNKKLIGYYEKHEYRNRETQNGYNAL